MLGCVKEVADFEVTVSLPCGLQGFLSIRNICDAYAKLLSEQLDSADTEVSWRSGDSPYCTPNPLCDHSRFGFIGLVESRIRWWPTLDQG